MHQSVKQLSESEKEQILHVKCNQLLTPYCNKIDPLKIENCNSKS